MSSSYYVPRSIYLQELVSIFTGLVFGLFLLEGVKDDFWGSPLLVPILWVHSFSRNGIRMGIICNTQTINLETLPLELKIKWIKHKNPDTTHLNIGWTPATYVP